MESAVEEAAEPAEAPVAADADPPPVEEVEAAETPGVEVPLGVLPCAAAAKWACIEDVGWN